MLLRPYIYVFKQIILFFIHLKLEIASQTIQQHKGVLLIADHVTITNIFLSADHPHEDDIKRSIPELNELF